MMTALVDGTQLYREAIERICQLEAEIERMKPVVETAQILARSLRRHDPVSWSGTEEALERAVTTYEAGERK